MKQKIRNGKGGRRKTVVSDQWLVVKNGRVEEERRERRDSEKDLYRSSE